MQKIVLPIMEPELVKSQIEDFIIKEVKESGMTGGVIGLSGGVDSTTVAALTKSAFDLYNQVNDDKLELVGYMLPSKLNDEKDTSDGQMVAEKLGIKHETQSIEKIVEAYETTNSEATDVPLHKGNIMSRIRANVLSTKGATEKKLVMGTGNKDEDFGVGYYTLFGDGAVHISPIGGLSKRLVNQMATYLGFKDIAEKPPAAGLEHGQTDFKDLGYGYDFVELVTEGVNQGYDRQALLESEQVNDLYIREKKLYKINYGKEKFEILERSVDDVLRRHQIAHRKSRLIHPPIAEITLNYNQNIIEPQKKEEELENIMNKMKEGVYQ